MKVRAKEGATELMVSLDKAGYHTVGIYDKNGEADQRGLEESADVYVRSLAELMRLF